MCSTVFWRGSANSGGSGGGGVAGGGGRRGRLAAETGSRPRDQTEGDRGDMAEGVVLLLLVSVRGRHAVPETNEQKNAPSW